jgi:hypothetical protein
MDADSLLKDYAIPDPCPMNWDAMDGDNRSRYCTACGKHVHDLTAVTPEVAAGLITSQGGHLCARLYQRDDGTLTTRPPQPAGQPRAPPLQFTIRAIMAVIAGVAATLGIARLFADRTPPPPPAQPPAPLGTRMLGGAVMVVPREYVEPKPGNPPAGNNTTAPSESCAESSGTS